MRNAASTASPLNRRADAGQKSAPALARLSLRWSFARSDRTGFDELVMCVTPDSAVLERRANDQNITLRSATASASEPIVVEIATSECGRFTSIHVADVFDAVFDDHDRCAYARSAWVAELHPLGGQCELVEGAIAWGR